MASRYQNSSERGLQNTQSDKRLVDYEMSPNPKNESETEVEVKILQMRLRTKFYAEHKLRSKIASLVEEVNKRKQQYHFQQVQNADLKDQLRSERKRHQQDLAEVERELRWNKKKVKSLEESIRSHCDLKLQRNIEILTSHQQLREANDVLERRIKQMQEEQTNNAVSHEQLIDEVERLKQAKEEDLLHIQNLENAVKSLHDENQRLRETPIPVVLPESQPGQSRLGHNLYEYYTERPVFTQVSLLDRRAEKKRKNFNSRQDKVMNFLLRETERWPQYDEYQEISWN